MVRSYWVCISVSCKLRVFSPPAEAMYIVMAQVRLSLHFRRKALLVSSFLLPAILLSRTLAQRKHVSWSVGFAPLVELCHRHNRLRTCLSSSTASSCLLSLASSTSDEVLDSMPEPESSCSSLDEGVNANQCQFLSVHLLCSSLAETVRKVQSQWRSLPLHCLCLDNTTKVSSRYLHFAAKQGVCRLID
jgi:hypothetical protein